MTASLSGSPVLSVLQLLTRYLVLLKIFVGLCGGRYLYTRFIFVYGCVLTKSRLSREGFGSLKNTYKTLQCLA